MEPSFYTKRAILLMLSIFYVMSYEDSLLMHKRSHLVQLVQEKRFWLLKLCAVFSVTITNTLYVTY